MQQTGILAVASAVCKGGVSFSTFQCSDSGHFDAAQFDSEQVVDFAFTHFGRNLFLTNTHFTGPVSFAAAKVSQGLILTGARFESEVSLFGATIRILTLPGDTLPFRKGLLDLREFSFGIFRGWKA